MALVGAGAISLGAAGCATTGAGARDASARIDRAIHAGRRDARAALAPPPPGLPGDLLRVVDPSDTRARAGLSDALARVVATPKTPAERASEPNAESVLLFTSGRSKRLAGDLKGAVKDLQASAKADPSSAQTWRELGAAQRQLGDGLSAVAAYRKALELDPDDLDSLLQVGLWTLERRDPKAAADLLARARALTARQGHVDPALPFVLDFSLGRALVGLGYLNAGADLLARGLALPDAFTSPTVYTAQLESVFRQRADGWREIGDARLRIGAYPAARDAYRKAAQLPSLNPAALLPRLVFVSMKTGDAASAARATLDALNTGADISGERVLPLIRHLAEHSSIGPLLGAAIDEQRAALSGEDQRRLGSLYARAAAAALPPDRAARALRDRLATHPADTGAVADLFELAGDDPAAMVTETVRLIESAPLNERRYAGTLLERIGAPDKALTTLDTIPDADSPAAAVLRARLLQTLGRPDKASDALAGATARGEPGQQSDLSAVLAALRIETLAQSGRIDDAAALLPTLDSAVGPTRAILRAQALAALGRSAEALDELGAALAPDAQPSLAGDPRELDATVLAANLAWGLGDADAVESYARRAIELDPAFEPAYARLIELYGKGGALDNPQKLANTVRALRSADPSSRTLRWLRARELVAGGRYDQAERDLLGLADEQADPAVIELLTTLWMRTGSTTRAEGWLRARLKTDPEQPAVVRSLARLLAEDNRAQQAVALLDDWLKDHAYDDDAARQAESILRDKLDKSTQADDRALARLKNKPATLARAVELADILIRRGDPTAAANGMLDTLDQSPTLPPALARDFVGAVFKINAAATKNQTDLVAPALKLTQQAFARIPRLPVEIHDQRLNLLARSDADLDETTAALDEALHAYPARGPELAAVAVARLSALKQSPLAVSLAEHAYATLLEPDARFFASWLQATWLALDPDDATRAIRAAAGADLAHDVMTQLRVANPSKGDRGNAELAMYTGDYYAANGAGFDAVTAMYDLAMKFDPNHEIVNNNYGYYLADKGVRLEEAERLIRHSLELNPNDPFASDSLGWVLYKQGVIADERDPTGRIVREGAASVLQRAATMPINQASPEVIDHLGDALWALGDHTRAVGRWRASVSLLEKSITAARSRHVAVDALTTDLDRIKKKLADVDAGRTPAVAAIIGVVNAPADAKP